MRVLVLVAVVASLQSGCISKVESPDLDRLRQNVFDTEKAFAKTMADRDFAAFSTFLSDEAIFISSNGPLRGKQQVAETWESYFEGSEAPFSWTPETVEVLDSGKLAISTGPVYGADGGLTAIYTSIWRLEAPDTWRIIFDRGNKACE